MGKGIFTLKPDYKVPTNTSMYCCVECRDSGKQHEIVEKPGPPARGNEMSMRGDATTIRVCTGCNKYDGPWVPAPY